MVHLTAASWTQFKNLIINKGLVFNYVEQVDHYDVFAAEPGAFIWTYSVLKTSPVNTDQVDFETYVKTAANTVVSSVTKGAFIDRSGTTSNSSNTSTQVVATNPNRSYFFIQNIGSDTIWINFTNNAVVGSSSIQLESGASFVMEGSSISTEVINIISTAISVPFTAKEK